MARISIEDSQKTIENRFALVAVAAHRARAIMNGAESLVKSRNKYAVTALREIAEGLVMPNRDIANKNMNDGYGTIAEFKEAAASKMQDAPAPVAAEAPAEAPVEAATEAPVEAAAEEPAAAPAEGETEPKI